MMPESPNFPREFAKNNVPEYLDSVLRMEHSSSMLHKSVYGTLPHIYDVPLFRSFKMYVGMP
jgi:hypothetical protein